MAKNLKTYVALIIDESGSMNSIRQQAINNFNEQLQVLKEESNSPNAVAKKLLVNGEEYEGIETYVSVVKFNYHVNVIDELAEVNTITEVTDDEYQPNGTTALYDAIGMTIDRFQKIEDLNDPGASVLFIIITDGQENASSNYTYEKVKSLVNDLNATNKWTFTFMGTKDALEQAYNIGFAKGNVTAFAATADGMNLASDVMASSLRSYYDARTTKGVTSLASFYDNIDEE